MAAHLRRRGGLIGLLAILGSMPAAAEGAFPTRVLSAAEPDAPLPRIHLGLFFDTAHQEGEITREWTDGVQATDVRELAFRSSTHTLNLEARVGLFQDLELSIVAPIVLAYESEIQLASGVGANSTIYAPASPGQPTNADDPRFSDRFPLTEVPAARQRGGFGDMRFGLGWSPVNDTKVPGWPTLTLRTEVTTPTGRVWDPADVKARPGGSGGNIGRGLTVVDVSMGLSKRSAPGAPSLDPYFIIGGRLPFANGEQGRRGMEPPGSGRVRAGTEVILHDRPQEAVRYAVDVGVQIRYIASGRTYSPLSDYLPNLDQTQVANELALYEDFANPDSYRNVGIEGVSCSGVRLDEDSGTLVPATPGVGCGELNQVDEHLQMSARLAVHLQPTRWALFRLGGELGVTTDHLITNERVGEDTDAPDAPAVCSGGPCFGRVNAVNASGEDERSPFFDPRYDAVGRRLRFEQILNWRLFVEARATF